MSYENESHGIERSFRIMLRPLMRFALRHALKIQDVMESIKAVLIEVAEEELRKTGASQNISKLSVATGMHRRDVMRLTGKGEKMTPSGSLISNIVGLWQHQKRYQTKSGKPAVLTVEGKDSEFMSLVREVSADLNGYTVLFELERLGIVEKTAKGVTLKKPSYVVRNDMQKGFEFLSTDVEDLIDSASENLSSAIEPPNLHLKTEYDNIPLGDLPKVREWVLEQGKELHRKAREYLSKLDRDVAGVKKSGGRARVALGTFSIVEKK